MRYFPLFMDICNKRVLICGGGARAADKIKKLQTFGPQLCVVSEQINDEILQYTDIEILRHTFSERDLNPRPVMVIAAEEPEESRRIARLCRENDIPVNAADLPDSCDFILPSFLSTEHLCIAVSTGGVSPTAARELKNILSEQIPDSIDEILLWARSIKAIINEHCKDSGKARLILKDAVIRALDEKRTLSDIELYALIKERLQ